MTQRVDIPDGKRGGAHPRSVAIEWVTELNEEGGQMRWLGSWLVSGDVIEGAWFYSGHGGERTEHAAPADASGVRVRRWVSEGLDPEYVDVALEDGAVLRTDALDFDTPQPHRVLRPSGA